MLGFLIGTACLIGFFKVAGWGHHRSCHPSDRRRHGSFGERAALRWLFERLDTTHGQEKVILEAVEELRTPLRDAREDWRATLPGLARATRGAELDHGAIAEIWTRHDRSLEAVRLAVTTSLARVHEVLDERQRRILADLLESGPRYGFGY